MSAKVAVAATAARPQIIVIRGGGGGRGMSTYEKVQLTLLLAVIAGGGYIAYEIVYGDACGGGILGKSGLLGSFLPFNPLCEFKSLKDFFSGFVDVGVGVPFVLDDCPAGWSNDGLICREPISCASGLDFFTKGCSGGALRGRLDNQTCPADHPDKIALLCYKSCPEGYVHVEAMPYKCRPTDGGNFLDAFKKGFQLPSFLR
jgi:hypothetical protein